MAPPAMLLDEIDVPSFASGGDGVDEVLRKARRLELLREVDPLELARWAQLGDGLGEVDEAFLDPEAEEGHFVPVRFVDNAEARALSGDTREDRLREPPLAPEAVDEDGTGRRDDAEVKVERALSLERVEGDEDVELVDDGGVNEVLLMRGRNVGEVSKGREVSERDEGSGSGSGAVNVLRFDASQFHEARKGDSVSGESDGRDVEML